ncbi:MAG: hypothetical protein V4510_13300 [bacterium]
MSDIASSASTRRFGAAMLLVALVVAGAVWIGHLRPAANSGDAGSYEVSVVGPDGPWWNGTVRVASGATVLDATRSAAAHNFTLDVQEQALGAYVRGIGPYFETRTGGWNFCIDSGAGFVWVGVAADQRPLHRGERIQWRWAEGGSEVC